jgi:hypothetical protein
MPTVKLVDEGSAHPIVRRVEVGLLDHQINSGQAGGLEDGGRPWQTEAVPDSVPDHWISSPLLRRHLARRACVVARRL